MIIRWCMGVTLLTFMPSRVAKRPIKIRNDNRTKWYIADKKGVLCQRI